MKIRDFLNIINWLEPLLIPSYIKFPVYTCLNHHFYTPLSVSIFYMYNEWHMPMSINLKSIIIKKKDKKYILKYILVLFKLFLSTDFLIKCHALFFPHKITLITCLGKNNNHNNDQSRTYSMYFYNYIESQVYTTEKKPTFLKHFLFPNIQRNI